MIRSGHPVWRVLRTVAAFVVVLVLGSGAVQLVLSAFSPGAGSGPQHGGVPETVLSDRVAIHAGQVMRYDIVLRTSAEVRFDVRAEPVAVSVKLVANQESTAGAGNSGKTGAPPSLPEPVFSHQAALTMTKLTALPAGKWTLLIERARTSGSASRRDTTVSTQVTLP